MQQSRMLRFTLHRLVAAFRLAFPRGPFTTVLYAGQWQIGPARTYSTLEQCRDWATCTRFADRCDVSDRHGLELYTFIRQLGSLDAEWYQQVPLM